jgi:hypothetical protein
MRFAPVQLLSTRPSTAAFTVATLLVAAISAVYATHRYYLVWPQHSLFDLANGFGPVLHTLHDTGRYAQCGSYVADPLFWRNFFGEDLPCLVTHRLPSITFFLMLLSQISSNLYFMTIAKDVIFYMLSLYTLLRLANEYKLTFVHVCLCFIALFLLRTNAAVAASLAEEEGYIYHLLPLLFFLLFLTPQQTRGDLTVVALIVGILYLTKSGLFIICGLAALVSIWRRRESDAKGLMRSLPLVVLIAAATAWGLFTLDRTGRFAIGTGMSAINGLNFYKGNNPNTEAYYPRLHIDRMDDDGVTKPDIAAKNEWEMDDYYKKKALEFIVENPQAALRLLIVRLRIALLSVEQVGIVPEYGQEPGVLLSMIPTRVIFLLSLALAVATVIRSRDASARWAAYGFLGLVASYSAPYMAGFLWYRHLMPVYATAVFYLAAQLAGTGLTLLRLPARAQVDVARDGGED